MSTATCPPDEACVLGAALRARAAQLPDKVFIRFDDGTAWTYAQALSQALSTAGGLRALGVAQGDTVAVWLPNGPDIVRCWFALTLLGAVFVPLNTGWRGRVLHHALTNAAPRVAVIHAGLLPRLASGQGSEDEGGGDRGDGGGGDGDGGGGEDGNGYGDGVNRSLGCPATLERIVVLGGTASPPVPAGLRVQCLDRQALDGAPPAMDELPRMRPWDLQAIVYTSGTTGDSKGVLTSHLHLASMALGGRDMIGGDDHRLVALPLFHSGGLQSVLGTLLKGGSLSLMSLFRTQDFWRTVRDTGSTSVTLLGAMIGFLMKAPLAPDEREHALRSAFLVPYPADGQAFAERFGVATYTNYNSTETSNPLVSGRDPRKGGVCGRPRPGVHARLVDAHDFDVADGEVGELLLRTDSPWAMSHGYHRDPQATADAWRNGWFHTGELFRRDADGDYFFVDRKKDAIRRRGENISTAEVEREILAHPAVQEAAVIGVPSEFGEDEVLAIIALKPGAALAPAGLLEFLAPRLAHFMIPRYVRTLDALPRTATHKVRKFVLREQGLADGTWDREAAGIRVRQQRLDSNEP
ncbi:MAG: AMP-binding protein [Burkholderiaceae bacterium]